MLAYIHDLHPSIHLDNTVENTVGSVFTCNVHLLCIFNFLADCCKISRILLIGCVLFCAVKQSLNMMLPPHTSVGIVFSGLEAFPILPPNLSIVSMSKKKMLHQSTRQLTITVFVHRCICILQSDLLCCA